MAAIVGLGAALEGAADDGAALELMSEPAEVLESAVAAAARRGMVSAHDRFRAILFAVRMCFPLLSGSALLCGWFALCTSDCGGGQARSR